MSPGRGKGKGTKKPAKKRRRRHVKLNPKRITIQKCNAPEECLYKPDDEAVWHSGDADTYDIHFYKGPHGSTSPTPFVAGADFTATLTAPAHSGKIKANAMKGPYRYRVKGRVSGCDIDPVIHIGP